MVKIVLFFSSSGKPLVSFVLVGNPISFEITYVQTKIGFMWFYVVLCGFMWSYVVLCD